MRSALSSPDDIPALADCVWMYTGAEGPPLACQSEASERYLANRGLAEAGREQHEEVAHRVRTRLGELLGLDGSAIGLVGNASEAINLVVDSLELRSGDNVVLNEIEYPSMIQPWLRLRPQGVEVRFAKAEHGLVRSEEVCKLVDRRTRVVGVSHVSYVSGWRHDLRAIGDAAEAVGALTLVDATQSLGAMPVPGRLVDVVVSSSYKWLLGGHGLGVLAWNTGRRGLPEPASVGWRSVDEIFTADRLERYRLREDARRFEVGYPSYPSIYALDASLQWLSRFDPVAVEEHILALSGRLVTELSRRGWQLMTSSRPEERAGNVSVATRHGEQIARLLASRRIHSWGGDGRLRLSVHLFNSDRDVDELLAALDDIAARIDRAQDTDPDR